MSALGAFGSVALTSLGTLAITELHVELVAGAAAWLAGWWLLRETPTRAGLRAAARPESGPRRLLPRRGPSRG